MRTFHFKQSQIIPADIESVWRFFASPKNLNQITPSGMNFQIIDNQEPPDMFQGQIIRYKVSPLPLLRVTWITEIAEVVPVSTFVDIQQKGPFTLWQHRHTFKPVPQGVEMIDEVSYQIPFGIIGVLANTILVKRRVQKIFKYRHQQIQLIFPSKN
jgi:ligand-binding SRPBCC domain-containing protein